MQSDRSTVTLRRPSDASTAGGRRGAGTLARGCGLSLALVVTTACHRPSPRPDLLLLSLDTLRADHLSTYGYRRATTPNLDRLAESSCTVYERSIASSTWTLPSHATMLTGLLPEEHGLVTLRRKLAGAFPTVADRLAAAGYRTIAVTDGGFLSPRWGLSKGFQSYSSTPGNPWDPKDARTVFERAARNYEHAAQSPDPIFLFVHSYETHQPYENREGFADPFLDPDYSGPFQEVAHANTLHSEPLAAADLQRMIALYDGEIRRLDHYLGGFVDAVNRVRGNRPVRLLLTSDHGEEFLEHGLLEHGAGRVEEENVRVPLLLCDLSGAGGGTRSRAPTSTLDIAPTLLEAAGIGPPSEYLGLALGAETRATRWLASSGYGSHPNLSERWLRLERGEKSWILRLDGSAPVPKDVTDAVLERALALLGRGLGASRLVLLPAATERLESDGGPLRALFGTLSSGHWTPVRAEPGVTDIAFDPTRRAALLLRFHGESELRGWRLALRGRTVPLSMSAASFQGATAVNPLRNGAGSLSLVLLDGGAPARFVRVDFQEIDPDLRALGYL